MALSGTLVANGGYENRTLVFSWTATQSIPYNSSTISWSLKGGGTNPKHWYSLKQAKVVIDGEVVYSQSGSYQLHYGDLVASGTKTLTHNSAGVRSFAVSIQGAIYTGSINTTGTQTFWLNEIPRQAKITSAPNFYETTTPLITYSNPAGTNATLDLGIFLPDGKTCLVPYQRIPNTGTQYVMGFSDSDLQNFYKQIPTTNSLKVRFYLRTYIGGNYYYDFAERTFTLYGGKPTMYPTVEAVDSLSIGLTGDSRVLIAGVSDAQCIFNAQAYCGATIKSKWVQNGDLHLNDDGVMYDGNNPNFDFSVRDSRDNLIHKTITPTIIPYYPISCAIGDTMPDTQGNFTLTAVGKCFKGSFGTRSNNLSVSYRRKTDNGGWGAWQNLSVSEWKPDGSFTALTVFTGLDYQATYTFQVKASDALTYQQTAERNIKTTPVFDWSKDDVVFNVPVHFKKGGDGISSGGGDYLPITGGTLKGDLRLKRDGSNYGCKLNFGDGNYAYIQETPDDTLNIKATHVKINDNEIKVGTWTPNCNQISSYTTRYGNYVKIGDMITITWFIQGYCNKTDAYLQITGIPYNGNSSYKWQAGGGNLTNYITPANSTFSGYCIEGNTTIYARCSPTNSSGTTIRRGGYCGTQSGQTLYSSGCITYKCA